MAPSDFVVTTAPGYEGEARRELCKAVPGAEARKLPLGGNVRLQSPLSRGATLAALREAPTRCVAHVVPVDVELRLGKQPESLRALEAALSWRQRLAEGHTFVVRCRRRGEHQWHSGDLERRLGQFLERTTGAEAKLEGVPDCEVAVEVFQSLAFVGLLEPGQRLYKTLHRRRKYAPGHRPLNRAELKLREALAAFGVELEPTWRALDLGAAPGGWSRVLAEGVAEVVAVDPGDLAPAVAALPNVRHLRCLADELDLEALGLVDLIVNDMNIDEVDSADALCELAGLLPPGGLAVMTVKFPSRRWRQHLKLARDRLAPCYEVAAARRLPHNRSESTLLLRRKPTP